jgi:hypothetical protein
MISTFRGMTIDSSNVSENADDPIRLSCEFNSNEINESDPQSAKHADPRISTLDGIAIT